jgi:sec-independent protein translocase protein TatA
MGEFSPWHLLIVAAVFLLLFGANKLPQMARSVGQSMRIFKAETRALSGEKEPGTLPPTATPAASVSNAQPSHIQSSQTQPPQAPSQTPPSHQAASSQAYLQDKPPAG